MPRAPEEKKAPSQVTDVPQPTLAEMVEAIEHLGGRVKVLACRAHFHSRVYLDPRCLLELFPVDQQQESSRKKQTCGGRPFHLELRIARFLGSHGFSRLFDGLEQDLGGHTIWAICPNRIRHNAHYRTFSPQERKACSQAERVGLKATETRKEIASHGVSTCRDFNRHDTLEVF